QFKSRPLGSSSEPPHKASFIDLHGIAFAQPPVYDLRVILNKRIPLCMGDHRNSSGLPHPVQDPVREIRVLLKVELHQQISALIQRNDLSLRQQSGKLKSRIDLHSRQKLYRDMIPLQFPNRLPKKFYVLFSEIIVIYPWDITVGGSYHHCSAAI